MSSGGEARARRTQKCRWAAELAASDHVARSDIGVAALDALDDSELLLRDDQALITAMLSAVLGPQAEEYAGGDMTVEE